MMSNNSPLAIKLEQLQNPKSEIIHSKGSP